MKKIAVFPGSFDPFTLGHEDIVLRSMDLFDEVFIALGTNTEKKNLFSREKRCAAIEQNFRNFSKIKVLEYGGLTVDFCKKIKATHIIRGLRNTLDFEHEKSIAQINEAESKIPTLFLMARPEHSCINASILRDLIKNQRSVKNFVPAAILKHLGDKVKFTDSLYRNK